MVLFKGIFLAILHKIPSLDIMLNLPKNYTMKKTVTTFLICLGLISLSKAQLAEEVSLENVKAGDEVSLNIFYFENSPFAYKSNGKLTGIEIDILEYFAEWVKEKKDFEIKLNYQKPVTFHKLLLNVQNGSANTIGMGSVSINEKRKEQVIYSAPYLKNVSVLLTQGTVPTALTEEDLKKTFSEMYPVIVKNSIHETYMKEFLHQVGSSRESTKLTNLPMEVIQTIATSGRYFGYSDVITFWKYMKENDDFIKMHKIASISDEYFGFIFPKDSQWSLLFNEFMESGFGFTSTKDYHQILEKHLSFEIIETVEIN